MARTNSRSEKEIKDLLAGYEKSRMTRRQYCEQIGIPITSLDYYRRSRRRMQAPSEASKLVKVELAEAPPQSDPVATKGFTLVLAKGRRIESGWNYAGQELARLIGIVEAV